MAARLLARCVHGLEWVCADEIARLPDVGPIRLGRREIAFRLPAVEAALLRLRTADDVFLTVGTGSGATAAEVATALGRLPWDESVDAVRGLRPVPLAPVLDVVAEIRGHRFNRFAVEHTAGPLLAARLGGTYLQRTAAGREPGEPDLAMRVSVRDGAVSAGIRLAAHPLHRRAWKRDTGPGTLHPPVAAALARLAAPRPGQTVLDPFCGDGTVAIETVLAYPGALVTGQDLDAARVANAAGNAARAGAAVPWECRDAGSPGRSTFDAVITNPPWNLAVDGAGSLRRGLGPFWRRLPGLLAPAGRLVAVADADLGAPAALVSAGFALGPAVAVRLAGRVAHVVVAAPRTAPVLDEPLRNWRDRAVAAGAMTPDGF